jgi:hypothetical protein
MQPLPPDSASIALIIQSAVAPVFLLNGQAVLLSVFAGRLARVVDRMRGATAELRAAPDGPCAARLRGELTHQRRRLAIVNQAIALTTLSAFLTCSAILALFVGGLSDAVGAPVPVLLFGAAVLAVIVALALFIVEVRASGRALAAEIDQT